MVFFPNENLELWEYSESTTEFNSYYEPKKEYTKTNTIPCDIQPMSPNETLKEFGEILTDTYKIYINPDVTITSSMLLRIQDKPDTYEIIGTPMTNNHIHSVSHKKIVVKKQRKPAPLKEETSG